MNKIKEYLQDLWCFIRISGLCLLIILGITSLFCAWEYVGRDPKIINHTIVAADQWETATLGVKGTRMWMIEARDSSDVAFDMAFSSPPTVWMSTDGVGWSFSGTELPEVYVRGSETGMIIEIQYFQ